MAYIPKLYLETTMFNFYYSDQDLQKKDDTRELFKRIKEGQYEAYTSRPAIEELEDAPPYKYEKMFSLLEEYSIKILTSSGEAERLADIYVAEKIIPAKYATDATHIAITTVNELDFIVSYNFQHIVKVKTIALTGIVNLREGYKQIGIFSPTEVIRNDSEQ
jgi:predicted nucleic acid-binding protein